MVLVQMMDISGVDLRLLEQSRQNSEAVSGAVGRIHDERLLVEVAQCQPRLAGARIAAMHGSDEALAPQWNDAESIAIDRRTHDAHIQHVRQQCILLYGADALLEQDFYIGKN